MRTVGTSRTVLACVECGTPHAKWSGQCAGCGAWNTIVEETVAAADAGDPGRSLRPLAPVCRLADVDGSLGAPRPTGIAELDRVLGGGLVPGSVTLLGGEPGIGKSTLLLQLAAGWPAPVLYVSAEESPQQVRAAPSASPPPRPRVARLRDVAAEASSRRSTRSPPSWWSSTASRRSPTERVAVVARLGRPGARVRPAARRRGQAPRRRRACSSATSPRTAPSPGRACSSTSSTRCCASRATATTPCACCGRSSTASARTDELGLFEMTGGGLCGVPDPSHLFLADRRDGVAGSAVVPALRGPPPAARRGAGAHDPRSAAPPRPGATPRASTPAAWRCCSPSRAAVPACASATTTCTRRRVGGVRLAEPGADLGVALAVVSALVDTPLPRRRRRASARSASAARCARSVHAGRRLAEAARLGVPAGDRARPASPDRATGIRSIQVPTLAEAIAARRRRSPDRSDRTRVRLVESHHAGTHRRARTPSCARRSATVAPGTPLRDGTRAGRAGQGRRPARRRRRPGGAGHLLGRVPRRRPVQPAAPVRAGQDGRRHHPVG